MRQAAANGSFVSDLDIADFSGAFGEQGTDLLKLCRRLNRVMGSHGADVNMSWLYANVSKIGDATNVDQQLRLSQP